MTRSFLGPSQKAVTFLATVVADHWKERQDLTVICKSIRHSNFLSIEEFQVLLFNSICSLGIVLQKNFAYSKDAEEVNFIKYFVERYPKKGTARKYWTHC